MEEINMKDQLIKRMTIMDNRTKLKDMKYLVPGYVSVGPLRDCLEAIGLGFVIFLVIVILMILI